MNVLRKILVPAIRPVFHVPRSYSCPVSVAFDAIPKVVANGKGPLKYILAAVYSHGEMVNAKYVVRAAEGVKYHLHLYDKLRQDAAKVDMCTQCLGGGYLEHDPKKGYIKIYGRSKLLGKANHRDTRDILCEKYPTYVIDAEHGGMDI